MNHSAIPLAVPLLDWHSDQSEVFFNPKIPLDEQQKLKRMLCQDFTVTGHVWMATSGSSGCIKWVALSKRAMLASAAAVNRHLKAKPCDIWLNTLPIFHVGGLSIFARAYLSGAHVVSINEDSRSNGRQWNPQQFVGQLLKTKCTLTSLVPAQVFDLVSSKLSPPADLRAVIVGGGHLSESLYAQGIQLGWPLLPSYGLTEMCSQVATASLDSLNEKAFPLLIPLDHVELKRDDQHFLHLKAPSLLTGYLINGMFIDPKVDGWFQTEDMVSSQDNINKGLGTIRRQINFVKIGGESVDLLRLDEILERVLLLLQLNLKAAIVPVPDERLGHVIHLAVVAKEGEYAEELQQLVEHFKASVLPFEKIRQIHYVESLPQCSLKVIRSKILTLPPVTLL